MALIEKEYLASYDLSADFFEELGVNVIDIVPLRKVFILKTTEGNKILKKMNCDTKRIEFINWCINKLNNENIIKFKVFEDKRCYKKWHESNYVLMDVINGREVNFSNEIEYEMAVSLIADIHTEGMKILDSNIINKKEESLIDKYNNKIDSIKSIKNWVSKYVYKNEFDKAFLDNVDKFIVDIEEAINILSCSNYIADREYNKQLTICHNDLIEHNFLIDNGKMSLIDFDYVTIDLRSTDIADIIVKGIKNSYFEYTKAKKAIDVYNSKNRLDSSEYEYIYAMIKYPRDFVSIIENYYYKGKRWEYQTFINRLNNKLELDKFRLEFLDEYKKEYM